MRELKVGDRVEARMTLSGWFYGVDLPRRGYVAREEINGQILVLFDNELSPRSITSYLASYVNALDQIAEAV